MKLSYDTLPGGNLLKTGSGSQARVAAELSPRSS